MGDTPLEKIRYMLYKWSQDFDFIDNVAEEVVIKRAESLLKGLEKSQISSRIELKALLDEYAIEHILLKPSV